MMKLKEAVALLRACDVKRWTIVRVTREQTVAEHQYRVWALALSLYDHLSGGIPHNSFEREAVGYWALVHDAEEIWTGDLPSTIKALMEEISPGTLKKLKARVLGDNLPHVADSMMGMEDTYGMAVVKIAECVESLTYYRHFSAYSVQRMSVVDFLDNNLRSRLDRAIKAFPHKPFETLGREWVDQALELL